MLQLNSPAKVNDYTALCLTYYLREVCSSGRWVCVGRARLLNFDRAHNSQILKWRIICNTLGRHLKVSAAAAVAAASLLCLALTHTHAHIYTVTVTAVTVHTVHRLPFTITISYTHLEAAA